jgi:hypothetical protein
MGPAAYVHAARTTSAKPGGRDMMSSSSEGSTPIVISASAKDTASDTTVSGPCPRTTAPRSTASPHAKRAIDARPGAMEARHATSIAFGGSTPTAYNRAAQPRMPLTRRLSAAMTMEHGARRAPVRGSNKSTWSGLHEAVDLTLASAPSPRLPGPREIASRVAVRLPRLCTGSRILKDLNGSGRGPRTNAWEGFGGQPRDTSVVLAAPSGWVRLPAPPPQEPLETGALFVVQRLARQWPSTS